MNKLERKFNQNDYQPKRFGLKYNRPGIILEYLVPSSGKLYHHKIKLYNLKIDSNIAEVMKEIYEKHYQYLDNKKISPNQILKLVERLKINLKHQDSQNVKSNLSYGKNVQEDKNSFSAENKNQNDSKNSKVAINELEDEEEEDYYKFYDYENEDLNKLNLDELKSRKDEMEVLYKKNAVLPGDDNFVFDVRV